jgi:DNA-binding MarR family transcriptional regulator/energy-coupling factor transporter ATP-binding protein EcfA2
MVFRSYEDILQNFSLFWNILSKVSVSEGALRRRITEEEVPLEFTVPRDKLHAKDTTLARNDLSPILEPIINYVFGEVTEDWQRDVLKTCYVHKKEYQQARTQIGRHFDRPPEFAKKYNVQAILESETGSSSFQETYQRCEQFLRNQTGSGSLILLMGGIGCGKTTFIHHFFNFVIPRPSETFWFYVDFTDASPDPEQIEDYIYKCIMKDLERKYSNKLGLLKNDLAKIGVNSITSDMKDTMILFTRLTAEGSIISLVLDNADQQSYVSPKYQERVLQIAKNLTETFRTITILTLREESFFRSTMSGVLDAFVLPVFHLSSPSFEDLVRSRLEYVLALLDKNDEEIRARTRSSVDYSNIKPLLRSFFGVVHNSLRSSRKMGGEILRFINEMSGGNMRLALDFFRTFLISGNTDVGEMLDIDRQDRERGGIGYQIPFHHVVKSIILEHSRIYSESGSRVMNIFGLNPEYSNSHFLSLRILDYLHGRMAYETVHGRGYVDIDSLLQEAERISTSGRAIEESIKEMAYFGLVQFENQSKTGYDSAVYVRITNSGRYYLKELICKFAYLDLMWMDTPILDETVVQELLKYVVELKGYKTFTDLDDRFQRTEIFLEYLKEVEGMELANNPEFRESNLASKQFMPEIDKLFQEEKLYIESRRNASLKDGSSAP